MNNIAISEFFRDSEEVLKHIFDSIRTENISHLNSAESLIIKISTLVKSHQLYDNGCNDTARKDLGNRLNKITVNLGRLVNIFKDKISKGILFSEKALRELEYLIGTIKHLSKCLRD